MGKQGRYPQELRERRCAWSRASRRVHVAVAGDAVDRREVRDAPGHAVRVGEACGD
jgi:hypothetical protein